MPTVSVPAGSVKSLPPTLQGIGRIVTLTSGPPTVVVGDAVLDASRTTAAGRDRHVQAVATAASTPAKVTGAMAVYNPGTVTAVVDYTDSAL